MAKKASSTKKDAKPKAAAKAKSPKKAVAKRPAKARSSDSGASDAVRKLLESPLVADLLAVGATAALATIAEHGFGGGKGAGRKTSTAVKQAGKAAAAAMGRRLTTEFDEIRKASAKAKGGATT